MKIKWLIPILLMTILTHCGYHLAGLGNSLPDHIKTIRITVFKNQSYEYGLENILTQEMADSFNRRAGIDVVRKSGSADAVLEGIIKEYKYVPTLNAQQKVTQYYISIKAEIRLYDLVKDEVYWENKNYIFHEIYKVSGGLTDIQSNRQEAWQDAAEDFAERVASVLLEGF